VDVSKHRKHRRWGNGSFLAATAAKVCLENGKHSRHVFLPGRILWISPSEESVVGEFRKANCFNPKTDAVAPANKHLADLAAGAV